MKWKVAPMLYWSITARRLSFTTGNSKNTEKCLSGLPVWKVKIWTDHGCSHFLAPLHLMLGLNLQSSKLTASHTRCWAPVVYVLWQMMLCQISLMLSFREVPLVIMQEMGCSLFTWEVRLHQQVFGLSILKHVSIDERGLVLLKHLYSWVGLPIRHYDARGLL